MVQYTVDIHFIKLYYSNGYIVISIVWCWNPCNHVFLNDKLVPNIDGALNYSAAKSLFLMTPFT